MKKVKFDTRQSIALQKALPGVTLTPEQLEPSEIEGWLVDEHVCIQKPGDDANWRVSLYPWGDKISGDFYTKVDATEYAKDVSELNIDWKAVFLPENYGISDLHFRVLDHLRALRDEYEADGYFKPGKSAKTKPLTYTSRQPRT